MASDRPDISVVVPLFNEGENVDELLRRLSSVLVSVTTDYEIVLVNDGSSDDTLARLLAYQTDDPRLVVVDLSRNFGKEIALTAGLDLARGAAVIPIDADLQDPPELIPQMVEKWREGYEVVFARRTHRQGEQFWKLKSASWFYRVINRLADIEIPANAGDFRLMDRAVVAALKRIPERTRFMKGLFTWVGFRQTAIEFDRPARSAGTTKWPFLALWRFALDGIFSFSSAPLTVWSYLGAAIAVVAFLYGIFLATLNLIKGIDVPGYTSLMVVVLFLGGIQLLGIGALGEYIARIFTEVKARPLYIVRAVHGGTGQAEE